MGLSFALRTAADKLSPNNLPTELKLIGGEKLAILGRGHADDCSGQAALRSAFALQGA
jgi:hypothetical protein